MNFGELLREGARSNLAIPSSQAFFEYSMSISCSVSMWSETNDSGITRMFLVPFCASLCSISSVVHWAPVMALYTVPCSVYVAVNSENRPSMSVASTQ